MSELQLDPHLTAPLAALARHRVEFVLVGDIARAIYDHGGIVSAVAIVPGSYGRNVERLATALTSLNARLGIAGRPDPRDLDWRRMDLRELAPCTFMTAYADIDVDFEPAGTSGYRDLFQDADRFDVGAGVRPYVASPDDLGRIGRGGESRPEIALPAAHEPAPDDRPLPPPVRTPDDEDDYDPGIWTEEEFRAIRAGRITF